VFLALQTAPVQDAMRACSIPHIVAFNSARRDRHAVAGSFYRLRGLRGYAEASSGIRLMAAHVHGHRRNRLSRRRDASGSFEQSLLSPILVTVRSDCASAVLPEPANADSGLRLAFVRVRLRSPSPATFPRG
jgi:hypothetical protein